METGSFGELINIMWGFTFLMLASMFFVSVRYKAVIALAAIAFQAAITSYWAVLALGGVPVDCVIYGGYLLESIPLRIDALSGWFILIINFTSLTAVWYGMGYLKHQRISASKLNFHWVLLVILHGSMLWICMLQHGFAFLIAWEIMSVSSMLLLTFHHDKPNNIKSAMHYLVQMHLSGAFLTAGFIWVWVQTGSFDFNAFNIWFGGHGNIWLFFVFMIGFGLKAEFVPLHGKVPHVYPTALPHVAAILSGVMVKLGIYGIIRIITFLQSDFVLLGEIVLSLSVVTGAYGILFAAVHRDYKRMLAYCTIENVGIIGIGIGMGLMGAGTGSAVLYYLGFGGALLHVLNHSLYKSLLFYSTGTVYQCTHTSDMDRLGGLMKQMPKTGLLFLLGALAIGGLPPFNGFISEFMIYSGLIQGLNLTQISHICLLVLSLGGLSIIGGISVLTFTKAFGTIFLGHSRSINNNDVKEASLRVLLPQYVTLVAMIVVVVFAPFLFRLFEQMLGHWGHSIPVGNIMQSTSAAIVSVSGYSALFIGIVGAMWLIRKKAIRHKSQTLHPTWTCAYNMPNTRLQYTGKSFSKSLGKVFNFIVIEKKNHPASARATLFPKRRKYSSFYLDFVEVRLVDTITRQLIYVFNYFKFIQNGHTQSYVLYGIVFILAIFLLSIFNLMQ